jgi:hypothetical protein
MHFEESDYQDFRISGYPRLTDYKGFSLVAPNIRNARKIGFYTISWNALKTKNIYLYRLVLPTSEEGKID